MNSNILLECDHIFPKFIREHNKIYNSDIFINEKNEILYYNFISSLDKNIKINLLNMFDNYIIKNDEYEFIKNNIIKKDLLNLSINKKLEMLLLIPSIVIELLNLGLNFNILPDEIKNKIIKIKKYKSANK